MKTNIYFLSYLIQLFLEWETFQIKFVGKIKTLILRSVTFSRKSFPLWDDTKKYCGSGQAVDDIMVHANCVMDT
jgi:hypothetical protein